MNRRPTLLAAITLTSAAALTLSACGGDSPDGEVAGAGTATATEKSASASASEEAAAGRPKIELPSDVKLSFTPDASEDPVENAILKDNAELVRALSAAIVAQDPRLPALEFYTEGEGAVAAQKWVKAFTDVGWTVTGDTRYFDRQVTVGAKNTASLTYCADESKAFSKVIKTGKIKGTEVTKNSYVAYGVQVEKSDEGVWELMKISSVRGAYKCQP
ncbi:hypothetical protein ACIOKD_33880 [Streptomyces sp. NPDC087844]|uniref:hypothetical protein n=1 Tax=Streptomyces sp. NPDC087844 TaxID=3365805 RepID=UPI003818FF5C